MVRCNLKILAIDIETRPALAYVWRSFKENISPDQIVDAGGVMSFAAKWVGEPGEPEFWSDFHSSHAAMIGRAWALLDMADVVLHYNGKKFDIPHLQREFMEHGLLPPAPFKQIDLLNVVKRQGRFFSNRLAHVAPQLGLEGKVAHEGFPLWVKCMEGDAEAWATMREYNIRDVTELEKLYLLLRPWVPQHPSYAAYYGDTVCPKCNSDRIHWRGYTMTAQSKFRKFQCQACGAWGRSTLREKDAVTHVTQITG